MVVSLIAALVLGNPPAEFAQWRICFASQGGIWTSDGAGNNRVQIVENGDSPIWSPDHTRIAFLRENEVWVTSADGKNPECVLQNPLEFKPTGLAWGKGISPKSIAPELNAIRGDESLLVSTKTHLLEIPVKRAQFGKPRRTFTVCVGYDGLVAGPAISANGKYATVSLSGVVWLASTFPPKRGRDGGWDLVEIAALASYVQPIRRAGSEIHEVQSLDFSPDGQTLAFELSGSAGTGYNVVGLIQNIPRLALVLGPTLTLRQVTIISKSALHPRFSPDGKWLLVHEVSALDASNPVSGGLTAISLDGQQRIPLVSAAANGDW